MTSDDDIDVMVRAAVHSFGGVDIREQRRPRGKWNEMSTLGRDDWRLIMDVNTIAPIRCAAAVRPVMRARGRGLHRQPVVERLADGGRRLHGLQVRDRDVVTRVLAAEFSSDNIRVNGIAPGMMTAKMPPEQVASLLARQTVRRQGRPDDLVGALRLRSTTRAS